MCKSRRTHTHNTHAHTHTHTQHGHAESASLLLHRGLFATSIADRSPMVMVQSNHQPQSRRLARSVSFSTASRRSCTQAPPTKQEEEVSRDRNGE